MKRSLALAAVAMLSTALPLSAAVRDVQAGSFHLEAVVMVEASPAAAYRALIRLPNWWDPAHTWSGSSRNLTLEPRAGGCFCEKLPDGGSVQHARVVFAQPGKLLRMQGAFGPLQEMPVQAVLTFALAPDGPGTRVTMTYRAAGQFTLETARLAPLVDQVLGSQLERFRGSVKPRP
jgi:uncharacterized protein YndB with AHSA1/START domain